MRHASDRMHRAPATPTHTTGVRCTCGSTTNSDCVCAHLVYRCGTFEHVCVAYSARAAGMVAAALNLTGEAEFAVAVPLAT